MPLNENTVITYPMHPKEQRILDWIAQNTRRTENACLEIAGFSFEERLGAMILTMIEYSTFTVASQNNQEPSEKNHSSI